jgi:hypothetical protein
MTNEEQPGRDTQLRDAQLARGIYLVSASIPIVLTIIATISLILVLIK